MVKNLPAMWDTWVWSLGQEVPLEKEMATHSSILAWIIQWIEEPGNYSPWGLKESDITEWLTLSHTYYCFLFITLFLCSYLFLHFFCLLFFFLLYNIVLALPYIHMNLPRVDSWVKTWVYSCFPSWTPLPPPPPYCPSGSSQCTSPEHPVSCVKPGLAIHFTYDNIHVSMPFSQISQL